jgi:hypothetical protein
VKRLRFPNSVLASAVSSVRASSVRGSTLSSVEDPSLSSVGAVLAAPTGTPAVGHLLILKLKKTSKVELKYYVLCSHYLRKYHPLPFEDSMAKRKEKGILKWENGDEKMRTMET